MSDRWSKEREWTFDIWEGLGFRNDAGEFRYRICGRGGYDGGRFNGGRFNGRQSVESVSDGFKLSLRDKSAI